MKKLEIKGLEGADLEFANQHNEMIDALEAKSLSITQLEAKMAALQAVEVKSYDKEVLELKNALLTLETEIAKKAAVTNEVKSLEQVIVDEIKSLGVNNVAELKAYLAKNGTKSLEIKAISAIASTANTDTVGRTNLDMQVRWTPTVANAFLQNFRTVAEASNKSKFGYTEGSYTGAAAYVGEGTGNGNSDSASASATLADYAKVQSVLSVNTEVYEDIPDFAAGLVNQMQIAISKFVDDEALSGDGLAPAGVQHIKGLLTYATTFVPADFQTTVYKANIADLISAISTKIAVAGVGRYNANVAFVHPMDLFKLKREKDNEGQPVVLTDSFGNPTIGGIRVVPTVKITENTLLVMDSAVAEWRTKRAMQLKMGQILADDVINDKQSAVLMARYQLLVRAADQVGIMKVTDIATALQTIEKPAVPVGNN
jgi:hypothetical protein